MTVANTYSGFKLLSLHFKLKKYHLWLQIITVNVDFKLEQKYDKNANSIMVKLAKML